LFFSFFSFFSFLSSFVLRIFYSNTFSWTVGVADEKTGADITMEFNDGVGFENDGGLYKVDLSLDLRKTSELTLPKPNEMLKADRKADLFDGKKIHVGVGYDIPVWRERDVTLV
jgi:hypothetical protein